MKNTNATGAPVTAQKQIAFTTDSRGRVLAFHYNRRAMAWQRLGEDAARLQISTGQAREVAYVRQPAYAECSGKHINCANCARFMYDWYEKQIRPLIES